MGDERKALRRKPFWRVSDFARYMGLTQRTARRLLQRYDDELHGMLLRRSKGTNRAFGFYWAALAKHDGDAFVDDPLETQKRVDVIEDVVDRLEASHDWIVSQTGANTKAIEKLKRSA